MRQFIAAIVLCSLAAAIAIAKDAVYGPYQASVIDVIDADTVELDVAIWPGSTRRLNLHIAGSEVPEQEKRVNDCEKKAIRGAVKFIEQWLADAKLITVSEIRWADTAHGTWGKISKDGQDLGEALIAAGYTGPTSGPEQKAWCASSS